MVGLYWTASEAIETTFTIIICTVRCFHTRTCKLYQICFPHQFCSSTSMMSTADRLPASLLSSSSPYQMLWVLHEPLKTCSSATCSLDMYKPHTHMHTSYTCMHSQHTCKHLANTSTHTLKLHTHITHTHTHYTHTHWTSPSPPSTK